MELEDIIERRLEHIAINLRLLSVSYAINRY